MFIIYCLTDNFSAKEAFISKIFFLFENNVTLIFHHYIFCFITKGVWLKIIYSQIIVYFWWLEKKFLWMNFHVLLWKKIFAFYSVISNSAGKGMIALQNLNIQKHFLSAIFWLPVRHACIFITNFKKYSYAFQDDINGKL